MKMPLFPPRASPRNDVLVEPVDQGFPAFGWAEPNHRIGAQRLGDTLLDRGSRIGNKRSSRCSPNWISGRSRPVATWGAIVALELMTMSTRPARRHSQRCRTPIGDTHQPYAGELAQGGHREVPVAAGHRWSRRSAAAGFAFAAATSSGSVRYGRGDRTHSTIGPRAIIVTGSKSFCMFEGQIGQQQRGDEARFSDAQQPGGAVRAHLPYAPNCTERRPACS